MKWSHGSSRLAVRYSIIHYSLVRGAHGFIIHYSFLPSTPHSQQGKARPNPHTSLTPWLPQNTKTPPAPARGKRLRVGSPAARRKAFYFRQAIGFRTVREYCAENVREYAKKRKNVGKGSSSGRDFRCGGRIYCVAILGAMCPRADTGRFCMVWSEKHDPDPL